jgi:hypothetical protein
MRTVRPRCALSAQIVLSHGGVPDLSGSCPWRSFVSMDIARRHGRHGRHAICRAKMGETGARWIAPEGPRGHRHRPCLTEDCPALVTASDRAANPETGHKCPMISNFPFCQLVVLDRRRLPLNFPRPAADGLLADTFMQPGNLPKRSSERPDRQTSLSRVAAPRPAKRANRTLCRPKIDNTDSSSQVGDARRGIFDVTGQQNPGYMRTERG